MSKRNIEKVAVATLIRKIKGLDNEHKSAFLELQNEQKRYGIVWEKPIQTLTRYSNHVKQAECAFDLLPTREATKTNLSFKQNL